MVSINVSRCADAKTFLVHKEFLCYYSPFFDAAFNGGFEEGLALEMDFSDVSSEVFDAFVNWIYGQNVVVDSETAPGLQLVLLIDLWILGDRFMAPKLQNQSLVAFDKVWVG